MAIKRLRKERLLSQEQLAEEAGISLRTVQRVEAGKRVGNSSLKALAAFFGTSVDQLHSQEYPSGPKKDSGANQDVHRSAQIIILFLTFFVCISHWLVYFAQINQASSEADLGRILVFVFQICLVFAPFAYLFYSARRLFVLSYYLVTGGFVVTAIAMSYWTREFTHTQSHQFLFTVFFTLMLLCLGVLHVVQLSASLGRESMEMRSAS
ncbi:MAG: helix-turn-helix domain-containing protein [Pseudomonadales bacterium]|nr:helix-turn-helix domain-containing protein [Pseudomonadales bacterium]MCP5330849.1 helix-turn-helix domain-containing protein [Pseudomonadales bacterium]